MIPAAFSVSFDHEQTRVATHAIFAAMGGEQWSSPYGNDTWVDPITNCVSLRPMCRYSDWWSSNSGIFAKPVKADYDFSDSAKWYEVEKWVGAGKFLQADSTGEWIRTGTAPGKNRGVNLAFFAYGAGDGGKIGEFGWHNTDLTVAGSTVAGEVYSDGSVLIYKLGTLIKSVKLSFGQAASTSANQVIEILLMPQRRKEILVTTAGGAGDAVVFEDIDEDEASPEITPASKFWFKPISTATSCQCQITPAKFETSGYITSQMVTFPRPPALGATLTTWINPVFSGITNGAIWGDDAFAGTTDVTALALRNSTDSGSFTPDGSLNQMRLRLSLSGDGSYTPFIYGAAIQYQGETALTNDTEESSPDEYMVECRLRVQDSAFNTQVEVGYHSPDALEAIVPKLRRVSNRPAKLTVGSLVLIDGRTTPTKFVDSLSDDSKLARLTIKDITSALEEFQFRDDYVFDGLDASLPVADGDSVVKRICNLAGIDDSMLVLGDAGYKVDAIPGKKCGEWSFAARAGDTGIKTLERFHQTIMASWFMGVRPSASGPQIWFVDPADLPASPVITLYRSVEDAILGGVADADAPFYVYESYSDESDDVDANEVWATGIDHRTGNVVQAYVIDASSQDATLAPSARPDNWIGGPKLYGVRSPILRTVAACQQAITQLTPIVTDKPVRGEFLVPSMLWYDSGGGVMLPVWRGDLVTLDGIGDVRVTSHETEVLFNDSSPVDESHYTFGTFSHSGGSTVGEIRERARIRREGSLMEAFASSFLYGPRLVVRN